ncbi:MAG: GNAT family N-acetyltransferase [Granulosicoccaceae bacterium]
MESLNVVVPDDSQWPQVSAAIDAAFLMPVSEEDTRRDLLRPKDRRLALMSGDHVVGGCLAYEFELNLPGSCRVPAAGLAGVGILPSAQGNGGLRLLIEAHLHNARQRGDTVSLLLASESRLYSRFAYAPATDWARYRLDTKAFALKEPLQDAGSVELIRDLDRARTVCAQVHQKLSCAGDIQRSEAWWREVIHNDKRSWLGGGAQFIAVHRNCHGQADAYALYVVEDTASTTGTLDGNQRWCLRLHELVAQDATAQAALFEFLCGIALVREILWELAPVDPPIKHLMTDPRQLALVSQTDMLWMRVLDVRALLRARQYVESHVLEFNYLDPLFPNETGCYKLTSRTDEQTGIERLGDPVSGKLSFGPAELAATILGGTRAITLYKLGRISGNLDEVRALDRLLLTDEMPFNLSKF